MKSAPALLLATLCLSAHLHAEEPVPVPAPLASHAESAESKPHAESAEAAEPGSPAGGAAERSEAEGVVGSPAGGAAERSEAEGVPHVESAASRAAEPRAANPPLRAEVSLTDGSLLKGTLCHRFLPAESAILGRLRIDLLSVESIAFKPDSTAASCVTPPPRAERAAARVGFRNGDLVTATLHPKRDRLVLDTLLGPLPIPLSAVNSISFTSSTPSTFSTPSTSSTLLYHCTFDSPSSITRPVVGPAGTFLGGEFVPGKVGNALRIPGNVPTALVDLPRGMMQPRGTIEFWSKIEDPPASYGDRGNPRFFGLSLFDDPANPGPCSTYLQFTSNDGMGMSGLCGMIYHRAMATDPHMRTNTYGPLLEDPAAWHHYAIVWDSNGLSFSKASDGTPAVAAIVLDGRVLQTFGRNQSAHGKGLLRLPELQGKLAFPVADTGWGYFPRPVAFLIDEFKIWSVPKTDFAIPPAAAEPPRLLYHCTFDDAAAIERPAAGPRGKYLGGDFVPGKQGTALRIYADAPAAQTAFKPGDLGRRGMFEFWAKMEEATMETVFGDGGNPRFFCLWADLDKPGANPRSTYLQWSGNDGSGRSGLCAMVSGCTATSEDGWGTRRYPAFLGNPSDWHHYAVAWDENGVFGTSSVVAVYVDGKLVSTGGRNELGLGRKFESFLDGPVLLGFPQRENECEPAARHVPFLIDEFKIWSAPVVRTE